MAKKNVDPFAAMGKKAEKSKKTTAKVTVDTTDLVNRAKNKQKVYKKEKFTAVTPASIEEPAPVKTEKETLVKVQAGLNKEENSVIRGIKQALFEMDDNRNCTNAEAVKVAIRAFDVENKELIIKLFNDVKADDGRTKKK